MEDLKKNAKWVYVAIAAVALIVLIAMPVADVMGKIKLNGLAYISKGEGFSRVMMILTLLGSIGAVVAPFVKEGKEILYAFGGCALLAIVTLASYPQGVSAGPGMFIYIILTVVGAAAHWFFNKE